MSKTARHSLYQKVRQKISVFKTNTFDVIEKIVHFGILIHVLFKDNKNTSVCYDY